MRWAKTVLSVTMRLAKAKLSVWIFSLTTVRLS